MNTYFRILGYLKPHWHVFVAGVVATFLFTSFDAFSFVLFIPFLRTIFADPGEGGGMETVVEAAPVGVEPPTPDTGVDLLDRLLDATIGRFVDMAAPPAEAIRGIIFFILIVFAFKNVFDFGKTYLMARVQQGVTRDLRDRTYDHLVELDMAFFGKTKMGQILSRLTYDV